MKKIKLLGLLILLLMILTIPKSFAQVEKSANPEIDVYLTKTIRDELGNFVRKDTVFILTSGVEHVYVTQFSNYIRKVSFQINSGHPIMQYANPVVFLYVTMRDDVDGDGEEDVITSNRAVLTSKGRLTFLYHYNPKSK